MNNNIRKSCKWTAEEEKILREKFGIITFAEIGKHLGKSKKAIERKVWRLKLSTGFDPANNTVNFWTEEEDRFLIENHRKLTLKQIGDRLGRTRKSIDGRIWTLGIGKPNEFWTQEKDDFVRRYYGKLTNKQLIRAFNKCFGKEKSFESFYNCLLFRAQTLGVQSNPFHSANDNFFSEPNITNSYYAGLIASDGCIDDRQNMNCNSKGLKIELHCLDGSILEKFKKDSGFTGKVTRQNTRGYSIIQITCCQQWFEDLENNFNITPRKSKTRIPSKEAKTLMPPTKLNRECSLAFLIGLIDGDGGINIYKGNYYALLLSICSSEPMANWAKQLLENLVMPSRHPFPSVAPSSTIFKFQIVGKRAEQICQHLMKIDTPRMFRKWVLAKAWIEGDTGLTEAFIKHRGKKMSAWKGVLPVLKSRGLTPRQYYES